LERRKRFHMPTVSLNERGVVVRGWTSSIPSIRVSLSLEPAEDGKGAEIGVKEEYAWLRPGSADP
jgi:hypothetical protein